jgi:hypothetical protein
MTGNLSVSTSQSASRANDSWRLPDQPKDEIQTQQRTQPPTTTQLRPTNWTTQLPQTPQELTLRNSETRPNDSGYITLARAELSNGRVNIIPDDPKVQGVPTFNIPNNVGANGYSKSNHTYYVDTLAPANFKGAEGLRLIGRALQADPTPGNDLLASSGGTRNDVGDIAPMDGDTNFVRSYWVPSQDPKASGTVINYTIANQHILEEGYVIRRAVERSDGRIVLRSYGEGNSIYQSENIEGLWRGRATQVWQQNAQDIFGSATRLQQAETN